MEFLVLIGVIALVMLLLDFATSFFITDEEEEFLDEEVNSDYTQDERDLADMLGVGLEDVKGKIKDASED